jgi:hypothetical protein
MGSVRDTAVVDWGISCAVVAGWSSEGVVMVGRNDPGRAT